MAIENVAGLYSDEFDPREVEMIGFSRTYYRWWRNHFHNGILRSINMGLIDEATYRRLSQVPTGERPDYLYMSSGGNFLEIDLIMREVCEILWNR